MTTEETPTRQVHRICAQIALMRRRLRTLPVESRMQERLAIQQRITDHLRGIDMLTARMTKK